MDGGATFYFLNDLIGARVTAGGQKVGKLADLVAGTSAPVPAVTHIVVGRPFGTPTLYVPWPDVASFSGEEFTLSKSALEAYLPEPSGGAILLKDYVEDKKVLDIANREVEIVYDIRLTLRGGRLFLSDVDLNPRRFGAGLRRWLHGRDRATAVGGPRLVSWTLVQPLENLSSFSGDIHLRVL